MMTTMTRQEDPGYVSSAVYNAVNHRDFSGLDSEEDYTDYGLHKYHADLIYNTNTARNLVELHLELGQEFGEAFDDQCDYTIDKWGDNTIVQFQSACWYWFSEEWKVPIAEYIADIVECGPTQVAHVTETF